jgi:hypothetical protein
MSDRSTPTPGPIGETYLRLRQEAGRYLPMEVVTEEEVRKDHGDEIASALWWWWDPEAIKLHAAAQPYRTWRMMKETNPDVVERLGSFHPGWFGPTL